MDLFVLMGQRKEAYPGEYAPEALECMDECGYEENAEWLHTKKAEADATGEFERTEIIRLAVDGKAIISILRPTTKAIPASVAN